MHRIAAVLLFGFGAAAQAAVFIPLGDLPGGLFSSRAYGVSNDGTVVAGTGSSTTTGTQAFRWTSAGGIVGIGFLPGAVQPSSAAYAISGDGTVIVGQSNIPNARQAFRWTSSGGMVGLASPGGGPESIAWGVSNDGNKIVGEGYDAPGNNGKVACSWSGNSVSVIGNSVQGSGLKPLTARAVSASGSVIVGQGTYFGSGFQAFRFPGADGSANAEALGDIAGGNVDAIAYSVSGNGGVIAGRGENIQNYQLFRWTRGGGMVALPGLAGVSGPGIQGGVYDMNSDGSIMVGEYGSTAFYWTRAGGMRSLRDVLVTNGATIPVDWYLTRATAISADGKWIAGYGFNGSGGTEAFLADLTVMTDVDGDGIPNATDNCSLVHNPTQLDADSDGYGNFCDGDLNNSGLVTTSDVNLLRSCIGLLASSSALCAAADIDGSGTVSAFDVSLQRNMLNAPPGPSGLH
jgi:probable HAF family extracellular repeat protein